MSKKYRPCRVVSGGALCDLCSERISDLDTAFAEVGEATEAKEFLYCAACRPEEGSLPEGVQELESALCTEQRNGDFIGFAVEPGKSCSACDHYFDEGEWLHVGVQDKITSGLVICGQCYMDSCEEG
ncbi:MAG: hypothetical protein ACYC55_06650 [Candidatus Geothermincolia bacterium]